MKRYAVTGNRQPALRYLFGSFGGRRKLRQARLVNLATYLTDGHTESPDNLKWKMRYRG